MSFDDDISSNDYNIDKLNYLDLENFNFNDNYPSLNVKDSDIKNDKKLKEFNDILNQEDILNKLEYTLNTYNIVKKKFDSLGSTAINKKNELYDNILKSQIMDLTKIKDDLVNKLKINGEIDSKKIKKLKEDILKKKLDYIVFGVNKNNNNIKKLYLKSILIDDANMYLRITKLDDRAQSIYTNSINLKYENKYNIPLIVITNIMFIVVWKIIELALIFIGVYGIYIGFQNYVFRRGTHFDDYDKFDQCMKDNFNSNEKCLKICEEEEKEKACETDCLAQEKGKKDKYKDNFNYDICIDDCKNYEYESFDYIKNITAEIKEGVRGKFEMEIKQSCIIKNNEKTKELENLISYDKVEKFTQNYKENIDFEILIYEKVLDKILNLNQDQLTENIITKLIKDEIILFFSEKLSNNQNLNIKKIKNILGFYPDYYQCPEKYLKYFNIDEKDFSEIYFLRKVYEILDDSEKEKFLYFNDNSKKQFLIEKYNYMIFNQKYNDIIKIQNNNNKIINILIIITIIITLLFIFLFTKK